MDSSNKGVILHLVSPFNDTYVSILVPLVISFIYFQCIITYKVRFINCKVLSTKVNIASICTTIMAVAIMVLRVVTVMLRLQVGVVARSVLKTYNILLFFHLYLKTYNFKTFDFLK